MNCPKCGEKNMPVIDSRMIHEDSIRRRRRECRSCGFRETTYEIGRKELLKFTSGIDTEWLFGNTRL